MRLIVRQDPDNSLWYVWGAARLGDPVVKVSRQGFERERPAKEWAEAYAEGWNAALSMMRTEVPPAAAA